MQLGVSGIIYLVDGVKLASFAGVDKLTENIAVATFGGSPAIPGLRPFARLPCAGDGKYDRPQE